MSDITHIPELERLRADGLPVPPPIGLLRRLHMRALGFGDRLRYRDDVSDGAHTHLTRWIDARSNRGIARLNRWCGTQLAAIDREIARLGVVQAPPQPQAPPPAAPADPKERVRWNEAVRRHALAVAEEARGREAEAAAARRIAELEAAREGVRELVERTRQEWIAYYEELANAYSRQRIGRRGLRPAPQAVTPPHDELAPRHRLEHRPER